MISEPQLITSAQIKEYKDISDNIDSINRIDPYIIQWQRTVLRPFLGNSFYMTFLQNLSDQRFQELLNGISGSDGFFYGIKPAISYGAYALLLLNQNVNVTRFGMVKKLNEFSEHLDSKELTRLHASAQSMSDFYLRDALAYLDKNKALYPEFDKSCDEQKIKNAGLRIYTTKR